MVESTRPDHREEGEAVLAELLPRTGGYLRIGISGAPGSGKSTFIEAFGLHLIGAGHRVAVVAVDPSSVRSGGSILGDKTRMGELSASPDAFIRPSPSGGIAGGVARRTGEVVLLCEAFGFDVVIVETVGVGQSEVAVAGLTDLFLLLVAPGAGDDLQGIKRGVMELADIAVVTKADGDLLAPARRAEADLRNAMGLMRPRTPSWSAEVLSCSALQSQGVAEIWQTANRYRDAVSATEELLDRRIEQADAWFRDELAEYALGRLRAEASGGEAYEKLRKAAREGELLPPRAARQLVDEMWPDS